VTAHARGRPKIGGMVGPVGRDSARYQLEPAGNRHEAGGGNHLLRDARDRVVVDDQHVAGIEPVAPCQQRHCLIQACSPSGAPVSSSSRPR